MSLYDGLDVDTGPKKAKASGSKGGKPDVSGWSAGIRMMQTHLRMKKAALTEAQRKIRSATLAPVVDLKKSNVTQEEVILPPPSPPRPQYVGPKATTMAQPPFIPGAQPIAAEVANEYDPAMPNEYEKVVKMLRDRRNRERDAERDRERESRRRDRDNRRDRGDRERDRDIDRDRPRSPRGFSRKPDSDEEDDERDRRRRVASKAAIAPPSSLIMEDSVVKPDDTFPPPPPPPSGSGKKPATIGEMMKSRKSGYHEQDHPERSTTPPPGSRFQDPEEEYGRPSRQPKGFQAPVGLGADSVAAKIMAKYGFKEGSGLGKHEQGLSTALQVEKTSKRGGKIIESTKAGNDSDAMEDMMPPPMPSGPPVPKAANSGSGLTEVLKNPSKVVLLRNMVGPGEVDDDLQPETAEECSKYGPVAKVIIYEEPGASEDEAVRIFVEFHRIESAIKAVVDLNGRYFGGRVVKGGFYDPAKFSNLELNATS